MDHDPYLSDDLIGTVYIDLNPLLVATNDPDRHRNRTIAGWFPIYDTLEGVRGELELSVKVTFYENVNPFRESSGGVPVFASSLLDTSVFLVECVIGLTEEVCFFSSFYWCY